MLLAVVILLMLYGVSFVESNVEGAHAERRCQLMKHLLG